MSTVVKFKINTLNLVHILIGTIILPPNIQESDEDVNFIINQTTDNLFSTENTDSLYESLPQWCESVNFDGLDFQSETIKSIILHGYTINILWRYYQANWPLNPEWLEGNPKILIDARCRIKQANATFYIQKGKHRTLLKHVLPQEIVSYIKEFIRNNTTGIIDLTLGGSIPLNNYCLPNYTHLHLNRHGENWLISWIADNSNTQYSDNLTGFLTRRAFLKHINTMSLRQTLNQHTVIMLSIDKFQHCNLMYGTEYGDTVLKSLAARLRQWGGLECVCCRWGGDQFIIVVQGLITDFKTPPEWLAFSIGHSVIKISLTIAIRLLQKQDIIESTPSSCIMDLEQTLHSLNSNTTCYYHEQTTVGKRSLQIYQDLKQARYEQFYFDYQPVVDLKTGYIVGAEALLRWAHPVFGNLAPDQFLAQAEASGLLSNITLHVIETGLAELNYWHLNNKNTVKTTMAFNVTPAMLMSNKFMDSLLPLLDRYHIEPKYVKLEITETSLLQGGNNDVEQAMSRLNQSGFKTAIDDFGTGYSNFSYLSKFNISQIKIDKQFLNGVSDENHPEHHVNHVLLKHMIALCLDLTMEVVVEGLETMDEIKIVTEAGAHIGQGYFFSKPLKSGEFRSLCFRNPRMQIA